MLIMDGHVLFIHSHASFPLYIAKLRRSLRKGPFYLLPSHIQACVHPIQPCIMIFNMLEYFNIINYTQIQKTKIPLGIPIMRHHTYMLHIYFKVLEMSTKSRNLFVLIQFFFNELLITTLIGLIVERRIGLLHVISFSLDIV